MRNLTVYVCYFFIFNLLVACNKEHSLANNPDSKNLSGEWFKTVLGTGEGFGVASAVDNKGNLISIGYFSDSIFFNTKSGIQKFSSFGDYDICIYKYDSIGDLQWVKQIGSSNQDSPYYILTDQQDNIYTIIGVYGNADLNPGTGVFNASTGQYLVKLNSNGEFLFAKNLESGSSNWRDHSSVIDKDGNFYTSVSIINGFGLKILKINSNGTQIWAKTINFDFHSGFYFPPILNVNNLGEVYVTGDFRGTFDFDPSANIYNLTTLNTATFIQKLDQNGNFIWAKKIDNSYGYSIESDENNNTILIGQANQKIDINPGSDVNYVDNGGFILKLDPNGNYIWSNGFNSAALSGIRTDVNNNIYVIGACDYFQKCDLNPGQGEYFIENAGTFITKINQNGIFVGAKAWTTTTGTLIDVNQIGNVYFSGSYGADMMDLNPGAGVFNFTSNHFGIFTCKLKF